MDDDKFLESIRYGDRIDDTDSEPVDDPETSNSEVMYNVSEEALSPLSQSSGSSISENCFDDAQVVQLVGILPAGVKVILQDEHEPHEHETQHSYQELKLSGECTENGAACGGVTSHFLCVILDVTITRVERCQDLVIFSLSKGEFGYACCMMASTIFAC